MLSRRTSAWSWRTAVRSTRRCWRRSWHGVFVRKQRAKEPSIPRGEEVGGEYGLPVEIGNVVVVPRLISLVLLEQVVEGEQGNASVRQQRMRNVLPVSNHSVNHFRVLQRRLVHTAYCSLVLPTPTHVQTDHLVNHQLLDAELVDRLVVTLRLTPRLLAHRGRSLLQRFLELHVRLALLIQLHQHIPADLHITRFLCSNAAKEGIEATHQNLVLVEGLLEVQVLRVE